MYMDKTHKKFQPLSHQDLEFKRWILTYARELMGKQGFENGLAAGMIYSSFTEYLAENLLENLKYFAYQGTYNQYAGIVFIDETKSSKSKKTLGQNIGELERFNFPDKDGVLGCMRKIAEARNNMMHQFAKSDIEGLKKIVLQDVFIIKDNAEELVNKIDVVYTGLQKILNPSIINPTPSSVPTPQQNIDSGEHPSKG